MTDLETRCLIYTHALYAFGRLAARFPRLSRFFYRPLLSFEASIKADIAKEAAARDRVIRAVFRSTHAN